MRVLGSSKADILSGLPAKVSVPVRLAYGAGGLVEPVSTAAAGVQFFLYTALLGLTGTAASAAAAISLCVDAFADPLLGSFSDDTRSLEPPHS